jgi:hypothetical protein
LQPVISLPSVRGRNAHERRAWADAFAAPGDSTLGDMNPQLIQSQGENAEMMKLQVQMQQENTVFTSVSNVLKTRQDTAKNSIGNIR